MKILHISDLHFNKRQNPILDKMTEIIREENIDFCIFSGDLTDQNKTKLSEAYDFLIGKLKEGGVNNVYLTCGNHDIIRENISKLFENFIKTNREIDALDRFVSENRANDFVSSTKHLEDFNSLIRNNNMYSFQHELYAIYNYEFEGKITSIVNLNLAWTAFNSDSYGKLRFPLSIIYDIEKLITKSDYKFLNIHFDLNYLEIGLKTKFSKLVREIFDCIFMGHVHDEDTKTLNYDENGVFISIAPCLKTDNSEYLKGFKIIDIDNENYKVLTRTYLYQKGSFECLNSENQIPVDDSKKMQLKILEAIQAKKELEESKAQKMFNKSKKFNEMFVKPILKKTSFQEINIKSNNIKPEKTIDYAELLNSFDYIIFGKDKSGKTTLLYKLMIDSLDKYTKTGILPLLIDFKNYYRLGLTKIDLIELIKEQYNFTNAQLDRVIEVVQIKILIDNFVPNMFINNELIKSLQESSQKVSQSITIMANAGFEAEFKSYELFPNLNKLFLHDITRKSIRELANINITNESIDKSTVVEKITKMFMQLGINMNFWTVTIFLYVIENTADFKLKNSAELIDLYIERLLDKDTLILTNSKFSFENYKNFLCEIAYRLYKDENNSLYCMSVNGK